MNKNSLTHERILAVFNNHPNNRDETIMATLLLGMTAQLRNISNAL